MSSDDDYGLEAIRRLKADADVATADALRKANEFVAEESDLRETSEAAVAAMRKAGEALREVSKALDDSAEYIDVVAEEAISALSDMASGDG